VPEDVSGCAAIDQAGNIHFGTQSGNYYIIKPEASEEQLILKKDLATLISESDSPLKDNWEAVSEKSGVRLQSDRMERSILALLTR
jgi:hypothetical protein